MKNKDNKMNYFEKILDEKGIEEVSEKNKLRIKNLVGDLFHTEYVIQERYNAHVEKNIARHKKERDKKRNGKHASPLKSPSVDWGRFGCAMFITTVICLGLFFSFLSLFQ